MKRLILILSLFLFTSPAFGSPARITVECAKHETKLVESTNAIEQVCVKSRVYFDIGVQFAGVAFNLNRPRDILAGYNAGMGYGFRWAPDFWTLSDSFLAIDLFLNAGLDIRENEPDAVQIGLAGMVTLMNIIAGGVGYQWELGFGDRADVKRPIGILAAIVSF